MAGLVSPANVGAGQTGTDFNQRDISSADAEQFILPADAYDPSINAQPLEVYRYWAAIEREREDNDDRKPVDSPWTILYKKATRQSHKINTGEDEPSPPVVVDVPGSPEIGLATGPGGVDEKKQLGKVMSGDSSDGMRSASLSSRRDSVVSSDERERAYRALRVASWQAVFYLITTDIIGFTSAPKAFESLGYGPGVMVYGFFYLLAVCAGQIIWKLYLSMDSSRFPVNCYADIGERTFGRSMRHIFNFFQSFQLLFNVALLIITNGQELVLLIDWKFCYIALCVFFTIIGAIGGQIRSLKNFAWFANVNVWLNVAFIIMTIVGVYTSAPVPSLSNHVDLSQPKEVYGWVPAYTGGWYEQVSGVQLAVFAYGGAMIFPEFMAEMRRPRDFWKSALCAQLFCFVVYMTFGLLCYSRQGQYTSILEGLNFSGKTLQLINNIISMVAVMVSAVLYGNIGVKVFYENVLRAYFKAPSLLSGKGRLMWSSTVIVYWGLAFVIGAAIPGITALNTLIGAACILQFTYTFPPALLLGYWMQVDAMEADRPWTPGTEPGSNRIDTWKDKSRWVRGFRKYWYLKSLLVLIHLGAWANCALGIYAGVVLAIQGYTGSYNIPFSCTSPNDPSVQPANSG